MKTEINLENKAKFFAQHWSQELLYWHGKVTYIYNLAVGRRLEDSSLLLAQLHYITDEDRVYLSELRQSEMLLSAEAIKGWFELKDNMFLLEPDFFLMAFQYLQSKGYALPWMGLSVEEMVVAGWVKLQS